jgi:Uma2 family endonuclease
VGFLVDLPQRKSFSPDASFHVGPPPGPKFLQGAPIFAAEVRSEDDYGPDAERAMAQKRADYFAAGTQVVWDVDVLREGLIRAYRATEPDPPAIYRRGERAEAEPALPAWTFPVDEIFEWPVLARVSLRPAHGRIVRESGCHACLQRMRESGTSASRTGNS